MIDSSHRIIIVTPVYEDVEASSRLFLELSNEFGHDVFVVAVDDGSVNQPLQLDSLSNANIDGIILKLRRNVGHQRAIAIGMSYVCEQINSEQNVVVMDSDGEDLPSTIPALLAKLQLKNIDVAVAQRKSRVETFRFKLFYIIYKFIFKLLTGRIISFGNFMAFNKTGLNRLVSMQELPIHIAGAVLSSKLRISFCPLDRGPRYAGLTKMNFVGLVLHGFKALMIFVEDVLVRVGVVSAGIAIFAVLSSIVAIILKLLGFATPGWFSIALGILVLIFLQTGALALMTLLLTGVAKGSNSKTIKHHDFVEKIIESKKKQLL